MTADDLIAALDIPADARVDQRVSKRLLVENGAPTAADKRKINEGIEELRWLAALKPSTIGVPLFRDTTREYLEIAVLRVVLREQAKVPRLVELIHRAIPYPVVLMLGDSPVGVSLAHKRWSQNEGGKTVLDGDPVTVTVSQEDDDTHTRPFLAALALGRQPRTNLYALYQGWLDTLYAYLAARRTGQFTMAEAPAAYLSRREALETCERLEAEADKLRVAAAKERQMARQVEMNLRLQRIEAELAEARAAL